MTRLVLWDVDGTLLRTGGAGRDVFDAAVALALGRPVADHGVRMSGKTDPQIAREILAYAAVAPHELDGHLSTVLEHLEQQLAAAMERIGREGQVLPGVAEVLRRLHREPGVVQSVLTGNLAANALVKLAALDLDRWLDLDVGAYGSDDHDRRRLVPVAREKLRARRGESVRPEDTWVVGDTPLDLECARAGGARCLLVATGAYSFEELSALDADAVLADLSDAEAVVALLQSAPGAVRSRDRCFGSA